MLAVDLGVDVVVRLALGEVTLPPSSLTPWAGGIPMSVSGGIGLDLVALPGASLALVDEEVADEMAPDRERTPEAEEEPL